MEEYILINDAILCVPGWLAAIGAFLKNNWQAVLSAGVQVAGAVGNLFSQKKANEVNAAEAEKQRNWQERMYNLHESPAAQFAERKAAGLNVLDGIQSQSVGSASTAAPAQPLDFSSFAQLPLMFQQLKSAKLHNRNLDLTNQSVEQDVKSKTLDNQIKALEAGNKELWLQYELETMKHNRDYAKWSATEKYAHAVRAYEDARQLYEFGQTGGNTYIDQHNKILAEIDELKARTDLTEAQKKGVDLANELAELYDSKFMELDYKVREQQVNEFLDQSDERKEMFQWTYELANHQYLIQQLQDQYDRDIWMSVVNIINEGKDKDSNFRKIAGILAGYFARDPSAALSSMTHLIGSLKPEINQRNIKNSTTVTYN